MKPLKNPRTLSLLVVLIFLALIAYGDSVGHAREAKITACRVAKSQLLDRAFASVPQTLQARAVFVYDFSKKSVLFAKDERNPLPLASLTKLMTVRVALKTVSPDQPYTVTKADLLPEDGASGFTNGDVYTVRDLVQATLIASSNDAATMVARSTGLPLSQFITQMNTEATTLNLPTLSYQSVTGLDASLGKASAFGSARDILMLLNDDGTDFPNIFAVSTKASEQIKAANKRWIALKNTNSAIPNLQLLVASKTGYTDVAGGNLAILWHEPGGDLLGASVLGSTEEGRFSDMIALHAAANEYVATLQSVPENCT